jgi:hypothetical protein
MWALEAGEDRLTEPLGIPLPGGGSLYDCVDHELCQGVFPATLQPQPVADLVEGGAHNLEVIWIDCSPCKRHDECPMTIESEELFSGNDDGFKCASGRAHGDLISSRSADAASVPKRPSIDKKDRISPPQATTSSGASIVSMTLLPSRWHSIAQMMHRTITRPFAPGRAV